MTKIVLSTSNIMSRGPSVVRRTPFTKSNTEFTNGLRSNFREAWASIPGRTADDSVAGANANTDHRDDATSPASPKRPGQVERPKDYKVWTSRDGDTVFVPSLDLSGFGEGLSGEQSAYDITVKLFFLPTTDLSAHRAHVQEAIGYVLRELRVSKIDLLIMSFPGVTFDADDDMDGSDGDGEDETKGAGEAGDRATDGVGTGTASGTGSEAEAGPDDTPEARAQLASQVAAWRSLEELHRAGTVGQLGVAEFGGERLRRFLPEIRVRPALDQINVRDCCVVPKSLILFGRRERIELMTHNDSTDILPGGTVRDLLGDGPAGAAVLCTDPDGALCGELQPQWVVKYTAVVKDRGVVENKGYFAVANLLD